MVGTKVDRSVKTKLDRIATRSQSDADAEFKWLMPLFNKEALTACFRELDGSKAPGIDNVTKEEYGKNLDENIANLIDRMKSFSYRPQPVKEVEVPKANGGVRRLGIPTLEDKIVQLMFAKVLEAVYDPIFRESSYGFRVGRNAHQTIGRLNNSLFQKREFTILDMDMANYFGTISHTKLMELLRLKIKDEAFLRYITRLLRTSVQGASGPVRTEVGVAQGSVCSPILANIYGHYAIDVWIEDMVSSHMYGKVELFRYCDDAVIVLSDSRDAERLQKVLPMRLSKFSLAINTDKTHIITMSKQQRALGVKQGSFDFLGFTFYLGISRKGHVVPKQKTSGKRFRSSLRGAKDWVRARRSTDAKHLYGIYRAKIQGHVRYFGVSHNLYYVRKFVEEAHMIFFKWMNRRSQKRSWDMKKFEKFRAMFPPIEVKVFHKFF